MSFRAGGGGRQRTAGDVGPGGAARALTNVNDPPGSLRGTTISDAPTSTEAENYRKPTGFQFVHLNLGSDSTCVHVVQLSSSTSGTETSS